MIYCIDTSSLIDCWARMYPIDVFPSLWSELDAMVEEGRLLILDEVYEELKKISDGLTAWLSERSGHLVLLNEEIQLVARDRVLAKFPKLIDSMKGRNAADPWVIALGIVTDGVVVTGERTHGNDKRPRIPLVCQYLDVPCRSTLDFVRAQGWRW